MTTTTCARVVLLCCLLLLPYRVSARLKQPSPCGNGQVGNGECSDPFQCCSSDGFCAAQHCHVVTRALQPGRETPSPTIASITPAPSPATIETAAPTLTGETPAPSIAGETAAPSIAGETPVTFFPGGTAAPSMTPTTGAPSTTPSTGAPSIATPYPTTFSTEYPTVVYSNCQNVANVMTVNFGYYQTLAAFRDPSCNRILPGEIDVAGAGYTHLGYSFVGIDANFTLAPWEGDYEKEVPLYREFNGLKAKHPNLKTIAVIGGWTFNNPGPTRHYFTNITNNPELRTKFAASVVEFVEMYNFDGVDIDWEFPGRPDRGSSPEDYDNLPLLVKAIREAYREAGKDYIISLAVPPAKSSLSVGFDLVALSEHVDFFTLLNYEIHGIWEVPPKVASATDFTYVKKIVDYILELGIAPNKLVFGLASFGHTYNLTDPSCNTAAKGCLFSGPGPGGCGGSPGSMPYFSIEQIVESGEYDSLQYYNGSMEMSINDTYYVFDNQETWSERSAYALEKCMLGYFWWAIDQLPGPVPLDPRAGPKPIPPTPSPTTMAPSKSPTAMPVPTPIPASSSPSDTPTQFPSDSTATLSPTARATTLTPSSTPTTSAPSSVPSSTPSTTAPSSTPTTLPSLAPSSTPTSKPSRVPTSTPTQDPTSETSAPTLRPTFALPTGPVPAGAIKASGSNSCFGFWTFVSTLALAVATSVLLV